MITSSVDGVDVRFSSYFTITRTRLDDWFDPVLGQDTALFVDPYLIFNDHDSLWDGSYEQVVRFFETAARFIGQARGNKHSTSWKRAISLLTFPEPHEFSLGQTMNSPFGRGTGVRLAVEMAETLGKLGVSDAGKLAQISGFALFCKGFGVDRISDVICNILKERFIRYTQVISTQHRVDVGVVRVRNASWSGGVWQHRTVRLPRRPPNLNSAILLAPSRFLKDIPSIEPSAFWSWAARSELSDLRGRLNIDLGKSLSRAEKIQAARHLAQLEPGTALDYLADASSQDHHPYDIAQDSGGRVRWLEEGQRVAARILNSDVRPGPGNASEFQEWLMMIVAEFKHEVEERDAWRLLWNLQTSKPLAERSTQTLAGVIWRAHCRANDVDVSREVDVGRGVVDFKFTKNWQSRALLEIKHMSSTRFEQGASAQLPQYLRSERISFGLYVVLAFEEGELSRARVDRVESACASFSELSGVTIKPVFVDASRTNKISASRL